MTADDERQARKALRRQLRQRRRALSPRQQRIAARALCRRLARHRLVRAARRVALYLPADGEIDPRPLIAVLRVAGNQVYLPVLRDDQRLWFRRYPARAMRRNRFGIAEPVGPSIGPAKLDLVLLPLVAFDRRGGRLGMGGGFYDRSFAFLRRDGVRRPRLVGLAHHFQEVAGLALAPWDVPLAAVVTDREWIDCRRG